MGMILMAFVAIVIFSSIEDDNVWSFSVEYLDDLGQVIKSAVVSATSPKHAEYLAGRSAPDDYSEIQVTRL